jgi:hypothetical protein
LKFTDFLDKLNQCFNQTWSLCQTKEYWKRSENSMDILANGLSAINDKIKRNFDGDLIKTLSAAIKVLRIEGRKEAIAPFVPPGRD